jgi:hypothetical protein
VVNGKLGALGDGLRCTCGSKLQEQSPRSCRLLDDCLESIRLEPRPFDPNRTKLTLW